MKPNHQQVVEACYACHVEGGCDDHRAEIAAVRVLNFARQLFRASIFERDNDLESEVQLAITSLDGENAVRLHECGRKLDVLSELVCEWTTKAAQVLGVDLASERPHEMEPQMQEVEKNNFVPTWAFVVDHAICVLTNRHEYTQEQQDIVIGELRRLSDEMDKQNARERSMQEVHF